MSVFETLNAVNVNDHTEKKNGLTYLSWAWAWQEVKKVYPDAQYTIYETPEGCIYWTDGRTCWVKTGVTINGLEHIEYLPIMDYRNASIPAGKVTSTDVNKAIQRSLTKACARHGLGLYIYAGEDLPDAEHQPEQQQPKQQQPTKSDIQASETEASEYVKARATLSAAITEYCAKTKHTRNEVLDALKAVPGGTMKTLDGCNALIAQIQEWSK